MMFYTHLKVNIPEGLHTRPCAAISKLAQDFNVVCFLMYKNQRVNVESILDLLFLCIKQGEEISFDIEGENCDIFIQEVKTLLG